MQNNIWLIVYSEGKNLFGRIATLLRKDSWIFPMLCFHLPSVKNPAASL